MNNIMYSLMQLFTFLNDRVFVDLQCGPKCSSKQSSLIEKCQLGSIMRNFAIKQRNGYSSLERCSTYVWMGDEKEVFQTLFLVGIGDSYSK